MIEIKQFMAPDLEVKYFTDDATVAIVQGVSFVTCDVGQIPHLISRLIELGGAVRDSNDAWNDWFDGDRKDVFTDWLNKHYHLIPKADKK